MNSGYKKNRGPNAVQQPPLQDRWQRCDVCFVSRGICGVPDVGTPLIVDIIRIKRHNAPNEDIAKVIRCGRPGCTKVPNVIPFKGFAAHGIQLAHLYRLVAACTGSPSFTMDELLSGEIYQAPLPASIQALKQEKPRPQFGQDYNPDEYIEPGQPAITEQVQF